MAHSKEVRDRCYNMYLEGMSIQAVSISTGISQATIIQWRQDDKKRGIDWKTARAAKLVSVEGIDAINATMIEGFAKNIISANRQIDESQNIEPLIRVSALASIADSYTKFTSGFAKSNPKFAAVTIAMDTLKLIIEYLRENDKQTLAALYSHWDAIAAIIKEKFGGKK